MIIDKFFIACSIFAINSACTKTNPVANDSEVFQWAQDNLNIAFSQTDQIKPKFFERAKIPTDYKYKKTYLDFNETIAPTPISLENADFLRDVGIVSALAEHCKLPWNEKQFLPMMQWQRNRNPDMNRQGYKIYTIALSHGYAMGITDTLLKTWQPDCEQFKSDFEGKLFADKFP